ncbi:hypothetical protein QQS21_002507 [Conoideocrella luteorostrata]|uniref:Uncharacterized protein n=1 Tax=Conoideocrella luteorostrata TaxID=1105319 RepID=A0AAJ0G2W2_9HYPO|nr:hypothetical protein QQS21_002507 [Conoideocrella luteorostrata]
MVKTYILAPNWTTAPPPDGPIKLGHLLDDLTEFVPLNRDSIVTIPPGHLNKLDTKDGFRTSRTNLLSGELGVFAKVVGLVGIGVGADMYFHKDKSDVLSCRTLDTMTFDPTADYIIDAMNLPEVKTYMQGSKFKAPLYMVTGLKIARGGSLDSNSSQEKGIRLEGGLNPPVTPVELEVKGRIAKEKTEAESWKGSTDFIVAFRVRKIWYQRGEYKNKAYNKNVVMQDGTPIYQGLDLTLQMEDDVPLLEVLSDQTLTTDKEFENGEEVNWIIPCISPEFI